MLLVSARQSFSADNAFGDSTFGDHGISLALISLAVGSFITDSVAIAAMFASLVPSLATISLVFLLTVAVVNITVSSWVYISRVLPDNPGQSPKERAVAGAILLAAAVQAQVATLLQARAAGDAQFSESVKKIIRNASLITFILLNIPQLYIQVAAFVAGVKDVAVIVAIVMSTLLVAFHIAICIAGFVRHRAAGHSQVELFKY